MPDSATSGTLEECADELNDFVATLTAYPPTVLAYALRAHLDGLLRALEIHGEWTVQEIAAFVDELASEARQV